MPDVVLGHTLKLPKIVAGMWRPRTLSSRKIFLHKILRTSLHPLKSLKHLFIMLAAATLMMDARLRKREEISSRGVRDLDVHR